MAQASTQQIYHWTHYGLLGSVPAALILSPSILNWPVDMGLGVLIPVHMHIGMINVIEDYVPRHQQSYAKMAMIAVSVLTGVGLLKVNLCGPGITESVKSLWRSPPQKQ